jgi:photosystem II stability/assembly factor-like uncharacterized protein
MRALCVALVFAGTAVQAQSIGERKGDGIRDDLYAVKLASGGRAWAVGAFGTILHSTDGGRTWSRQAAPTTEPLFGVDVLDDHHGWIVGRAGLVLATTDGGATWQQQSSSTEKHLFDVDFVDEKFGCAVGDWGAIVLTTDGGLTWKAHELKQDVILNGVSLLDRNRGWIVGEAGMVLSTDDGGVTWVRHDVGVNKTFFGVHFANERRGWVVGIDALILATDDGGATWRVQNGLAEASGLDQVGFAYAYENPSLYEVAVSGTTGVAVGDMGGVFWSEDAGRTWKRREMPAEWGLRWFAHVDLISESDGLIVGAEGSRLSIRNGRLQIPDK